MESKIILGVDPGLAHTGWGVVEACASKIYPLAYGCIETSADADLPSRLAHIARDMTMVFERYEPSEMSVESIFFAANAKSAMLTAQARGAVLTMAGLQGIDYAEYTPLQIKQAVVGTGAADKYQVQYMIKAILGFDHEPKPDHAADALAAAVCHARMRTPDAVRKALKKLAG